MSDNCPKCGAIRDFSPRWRCDSMDTGGHFIQSDRCKIFELKNENDALRAAITKLEMDNATELKKTEELDAACAVMRKALGLSWYFREFSEEWHDSQNADVVEFMRLRELATASNAGNKLLNQIMQLEDENATLLIKEIRRLLKT